MSSFTLHIIIHLSFHAYQFPCWGQTSTGFLPSRLSTLNGGVILTIAITIILFARGRFRFFQGNSKIISDFQQLSTAFWSCLLLPKHVDNPNFFASRSANTCCSFGKCLFEQGSYHLWLWCFYPFSPPRIQATLLCVYDFCFDEHWQLTGRMAPYGISWERYVCLTVLYAFLFCRPDWFVYVHIFAWVCGLPSIRVCRRTSFYGIDSRSDT